MAKVRKAAQSAPVCVICGESQGVQFAIFNPRFQPFGTACVACEGVRATDPERTAVSGKVAPWGPAELAEWRRRVAPLLQEGETVEQANYFTPRPWRNEFDRGSDTFGFCYIVNPGRLVCVVDWRQP